MSEGKSSLLFTKDGNESQEDIWDDTALIRAYEKSVKSIREKLDSKLILEARDKPKENLEIKEKLNDLDSDDDDIEENNYEDYSGINEFPFFSLNYLNLVVLKKVAKKFGKFWIFVRQYIAKMAFIIRRLLSRFMVMIMFLTKKESV